MAKPWGMVDPNSQHQLWSEWSFRILNCGKHPAMKDVEYNVARFLRKGFGSVGRVRVMETIDYWVIQCHVEGVPAHDPRYVASVRDQFQKNFVEKGWGSLSVSYVDVRILAGDAQDGKPASQLIVMPCLVVSGDN